jgi:hypothetical protein
VNKDSFSANLYSFGSLFHCIGLSSIVQGLFSFENSPLFSLIASCLENGAEDEALCRLYDQIFVENLVHVKAIKELSPPFLLTKIRQINDVNPSNMLSYYEEKLSQDPYPTMHDLTLYLAWDRVCAHTSFLFETPSSSFATAKGLDAFKECLIESFEHITKEKKTRPSFFSLMQALYAYYLREDNLKTHDDKEWQALCKSAKALRSRDLLHDVSYVDLCLEQSISTSTLDCEETVKNTLLFANTIIEKLKKERPSWPYTLYPCKIFYQK